MRKQKVFAVVLVICVLMAALLATIYAGYNLAFVELGNNADTYRTYDYHIALITDEQDTEFWDEVYLSAIKTGEEYNVYVEQTGEDLFGQLTIEDAFNIAIYQDVDGILLCPGDEEAMQDLIGKASERDIPVITMQKDVPHSNRQGFVGTNDYWMGHEYGKRIKHIANEDTKLVTILFPGASFNATNRSWFQKGITDVLQDTKIKLDIRVVLDENGINNAEDILQHIFIDSWKKPDIIICLDELLTQSTVQALQQMASPEDVKVIASYASQKTLEGIEQGLIDSTITIDAAALGRESVKAMITYLKYNMVSYHTEIGNTLVDSTS